MARLLVLPLFFALAQPTQAAIATISGSVKQASTNVAIETMYMYAENNATGVSSYGLTDAAGNYTISIGDAATNTAGTYTVYNLYYSYNDGIYYYYVKQTQPVTLTNGENEVNINFLLDQHGMLTGHVYASDGVTPLYNALLSTVATINGATFYSSDYTTGAGYYTVSPFSYASQDIPNSGTHTVTVTLPGYFGASGSVTLAKNTTVTANFNLTRGSVVTGKVTDTAGTGIAGATATLSEIGTSRIYNAITDNAGNYSISVYDSADYGGTAVGYYNLSATATNYVTQSTGIHITTDESTLSANNFSLSTAGSITGIIYEADGATPLATATIQADDGHGNVTSTTSTTTGNYTFSGLRTSDNYTLTVSKTGFVTQKAYQIAVVVGQTTADQNFSLATAASFSGTVTDKSTGNGIGGVTVTLYNLAKPRWTSYTADYTTTSTTDGSFTIPNIVPGKYRVKFVKPGYLTRKQQRLNLVTTVSGKAYQLAPATGIFGRVTHKHQPVANALIYIYSAQDTDVGYGTVSTDAKGFYSLSNLKAGTYLLHVFSTGYADKIVKRTIKKTTTRVNINVGASGSVAGFIYDTATQLPLAGYTVRVRNQAVTASTDGNGYYVLDGLAPGNYNLYVMSAVYETATNKNVVVKSNKETKQVNFNLTPKN